VELAEKPSARPNGSGAFRHSEDVKRARPLVVVPDHGARRQRRKIKNSHRAGQRSDCFDTQCVPNLGSQTKCHDVFILRQTASPINADAASLASRSELFCRIIGVRRHRCRKAQRFQPLRDLCCAAQMGGQGTRFV
jgi:hypothetical protein